MVRRFKDQNLKVPDLTKAEANEKTLKEQFKVLDVARPLLFLREKMAEKEELKGSPMAIAVDTALRLWSHIFQGIMATHRENLLKVSDPKFLALLAEPERFKPRQCGSLFGRTFIKGIVKEARDDQQLRIISRGSGSTSTSKARGSGYNKNYKNSFNGSYRGSSGRGSSNGAGFNKNQGGNFNSNRNVSNSFIQLSGASSLKVGARLCHFVPFWEMLSRDPWILCSIREGVKIDFINTPFQTVAGRNQGRLYWDEDPGQDSSWTPPPPPFPLSNHRAKNYFFNFVNFFKVIF
jgi:hypothetical protein